MLFFLLNFKYLEVPELLLFPTDVDSSMIGIFDGLATYAMMSHCSGTVLEGSLSGGFLKSYKDTSASSFGYAFESTDRMQLIAVTPTAFPTGAYLGGIFPAVNKILSCRATVFMDLLLFRRNMQMTMVSAEDKCEGCKVHMGYDRNFAALAPYFQVSNSLVTSSETIAVIGASAGAVLAIFGAIELDGESMMIKTVQTFGMPRPGNKAFSTFVEEGTYPTFSLVYYRDPMPHIPPTILGYRQASSNYAWVYRPVTTSTNSMARASGFFMSSSLPMDHYIANKIFFFRITDHLMYFATKGVMTTARGPDDALTACGQYADEMLAETHTSDLFYF
jgi:hypothetical protein